MQEYASGFAEVSAFFSSDREGGLFSCCRELSARSILYMQSELASLEDDLLVMDREEMAESRPSQRVMDETCPVDWDTLERMLHRDERQKRRMGLTLEIRKLMKEYRTLPSSSRIANGDISPSVLTL